jgi:hypothetical protein
MLLYVRVVAVDNRQRAMAGNNLFEENGLGFGAPQRRYLIAPYHAPCCAIYLIHVLC